MELYKKIMSLHGQKGQSLFEVIFTLAVAAVMITGIVSLANNSIGNASFSRNKTLATKYAEEALSWIRSERDSDWTAFVSNFDSSNSSLTFCLDGLDWPTSTPTSCWTYAGNCNSGCVSRRIGTVFYEIINCTSFGAGQLCYLPSTLPCSIDGTGSCYYYPLPQTTMNSRSRRQAPNPCQNQNQTVSCHPTIATCSWQTISSVGGACTSTDFISGTIFKREAELNCYNNATLVSCNNSGVSRVAALVTVSWDDSKGTHNVTSATELYNWINQ